MDIHQLINPVSNAAQETKKRPSEAPEPQLPRDEQPSPIDERPISSKRAKTAPSASAVNGHAPEAEQQQASDPVPAVGKNGLPLVPSHLKIRETPIWARMYADGKSEHLELRLPTEGGSSALRTMAARPATAVSVGSASGGAGGGGGGARGSSGPPASPQPPQLRLWEANILDQIPLDQISKSVADWLFGKVVMAPDLGSQAKWEVEAKLGHIIDQTTNVRLRLPGLTDFILDKSSLRVAFRSSMTEGQHRYFNDFLNNALMRSLPSKEPATTPVDKPRIPISYKHTRQVDSFYVLTPESRQQLPPSTQRYINNRSRVRITKDLKTGELLAKIVKLRVDDLDIYSPSTAFDVRISANVEVEYNGPIEELTPVSEGGKDAPPRNKDRMTYQHLAYQIDLTQVTTVEGGAIVDKEHELEVELQKIDELRQQGARASKGESSNYVQMVNGFLDNIRLLQRTAQMA